MEYNFDDYETLLKGEPNKDLLKTEIFEDYKNAFDNLNSTKNRKKQSNFKKLSEVEQEKALNELFNTYLTKIEKEKLYYFTLASSNQNEVIIVKAPSDNKSSKKFLGYEWSTAKGNEGIKLYTDVNNKHLTLLYDETNRYNTEKINHYIQQAFEKNNPEIPEELTHFVSRSSLVNMIDFKRTDFNKAFSISLKKNITIDTNWETENIGKLIKEQPKSKIQVKTAENCINGNYIFFTSGKKTLKFTEFLVEKENIFLSTGGNAIVKYYNGKAGYSIDTFVIQSIDETKIKTKYIFFFLEYKINIINEYYFKGVGLKHLQKTNFRNITIPIPPKSIQEEIVIACQKVDTKKEQAEQSIKKAKTVIEKLIDDTLNNNPTKKIQNLCIVQSGGTPKRNTKEYWNGSINWIGSTVCQNSIINEKIVKEKITELGLKNSSAKIFSKETVLIALVGTTIGKVAFLEFETTTNQNIAGIYPKDTNKLLPKFLFYSLLATYENNFNKDKGRFTMANLTRIKNLLIPSVPISDQKKVIKKIEKQEIAIKKARVVINGVAEQKQKVLIDTKWETENIGKLIKEQPKSKIQVKNGVAEQKQKVLIDTKWETENIGKLIKEQPKSKIQVKNRVAEQKQKVLIDTKWKTKNIGKLIKEQPKSKIQVKNRVAEQKQKVLIDTKWKTKNIGKLIKEQPKSKIQVKNRVAEQKQKVLIDTKWKTKNIGKLIKEQPKSKIQVKTAENCINGNYIFFTSGKKILKFTEFLVEKENIFLSTGGNVIVKYYNGKAGYSIDTFVIQSIDETKIKTKYIFFFLEYKINIIDEYYFKGVNLKRFQKTNFRNIKISIPPKSIQEKIVIACQKVDTKKEQAEQSIEKAKNSD